MISILELDKILTLAINGCHSLYFDNFFYIYTQTIVWIPLLLLLLFLFWSEWGWRSIYIVLGIAIVILLADQISSSLFKPLVARLRPSHAVDIADSIHIVNGYRGGLYGFVSSHAANSVGFVVFTALLLRNKIYIITFSIWAFLTIYSRVYLGVHYVGDVICGALIGALVGYLVYYIFRKIFDKNIYFLTSKFRSLFFNLLLSCALLFSMLAIAIYSFCVL